MIENIHVDSAFNWFPLHGRLRFTHPYHLDENLWPTAFVMATGAIEVLGVHEIGKRLVSSVKFEFGSAFLALAQECSIRHGL